MSKKEKLITAEEVKIIAETKTIYRAEGQGVYYLTESDARNAAATAAKCTACGCLAEKYSSLCSACNRRKARERHMEKLAAAPEWDGKYPVCLGDEFFRDESEVLEHLAEHNIHPENIVDLYACTPVFAKDALDKFYLLERVVESMGGEEPECPAEIETAIDEFINRIKAINDPISWRGDKLVRLSGEQIGILNKKIEDGK